jgi:hypothetical protein
MEQTLIVIIGFLGPFMVVGIVGIFVLHHLEKKEELAERPRRNYSLFSSPRHRGAKMLRRKRIKVTVTVNGVQGSAISDRQIGF